MAEILITSASAEVVNYAGEYSSMHRSFCRKACTNPAIVSESTLHDKTFGEHLIEESICHSRAGSPEMDVHGALTLY